MNKDSLGDRIKGYENISRNYLMARSYTLLRIDGKSFHTFCKNFKKPFDETFMSLMDQTAIYLCKNITGAQFAFVQSDEITVLLTDFETFKTQGWFDYNIQKMTSVGASMATKEFNHLYLLDKLNSAPETLRYDLVSQLLKIKTAEFDARVFQVPNAVEVANAILWRQQDATRNSISMTAQAHFSHKELHKVSTNAMQEMLWSVHKINWNEFEPYFKRGRIIRKEKVEIDNGPTQEVKYSTKWVVDRKIPIFSVDKDYLNNLIPKEDAI